MRLLGGCSADSADEPRDLAVLFRMLDGNSFEDHLEGDPA
jgi:hypothetical protein